MRGGSNRSRSETGERILGPTGEAILHQLDHEQHNLRAALAWSIAPGGDVAIGLRIMGWTWRWFQQRAHLREGRVLAHDLLAARERRRRNASPDRGAHR